MAETKKYYTFLNVTDGLEGVKNCTTIVTLSNFEMKDLEDGKKVLHCVAPVTNRDKALATALGAEITSKDDTVWVDVNFWNERAERFQKFVGDRKTVRVVLCGRLSLRKWTVEGTEKQRVQIAGNDWFSLASTPSAKQEDAVEAEELY